MADSGEDGIPGDRRPVILVDDLCKMPAEQVRRFITEFPDRIVQKYEGAGGIEDIDNDGQGRYEGGKAAAGRLRPVIPAGISILR